MVVGFQVNTNTSILVSSLRETLSLSVLVFLVIKTAETRSAKFVGIKVDCKDSKFANKISPLCKNKIKLFYISCLTKPDPRSIFSITEFSLRDNFLSELSLSLKRIIKVVWGQLCETRTTNPGLQLTSLILDLRPKGPL